MVRRLPPLMHKHMLMLSESRGNSCSARFRHLKVVDAIRIANGARDSAVMPTMVIVLVAAVLGGIPISIFSSQSGHGFPIYWGHGTFLTTIINL